MQLIPLNGKIPAWSNWTDVPPLEPNEAREHLEVHGNNIGIRTGVNRWSEEHYVVIDVDLYADGAAGSLEDLDLPETWSVETGGGGLHFYFSAPKDVEVRNSQRTIAPGIDIRGQGGQVVAPGSVHPETGRPYKWKNAPGGEVRCAQLPQELAERFSKPRSQEAKVKAHEMADLDLVEHGDDPLQAVPGVSEGIRNNSTFRLAKRALENTDGAVDTVLESLLSWNQRCDPPDAEKTVRTRFESALKNYRKENPHARDDDRPLIWIGDNLENCVDQAEDVLHRMFPAGHPRALYSHGGVLCHVAEGTSDKLEIRSVFLATLRERLSAAARFRIQTGQKHRNVLPTTELVTALLKRGVWKFKKLRSVHNMPFMRDDGSIVHRKGYDADTRCIAAFKEPDYPELADIDTTQEAAQKAYEKLCEPLCDFPFKSPGDRAAALAIPLTIIARHAIRGAVPLFAVRSHTPGSGKGLLTQTVVSMATGKRPAMGLPVDGAEELRKKLFSLALAGQQVVVFDNEEGVFGTKALSAILTASHLEDRVLGASRTAQVPWEAVCIVTGNNLSFRKDQGRRTIAVDLDPELERPEEREGFKFPDVVSHIEDNCMEYLTACLTILHAYYKSGRPLIEKSSFGGFESWNLLIRQSIIWASGEDPLTTRKRIHDSDDADTYAISEFFAAWYRIWQNESITTRTLIDCNDVQLRDALKDLVKDKISPQRVGYALRHVRGRIIAGYKLAGKRGGGNVQRWRVLNMRASTAEEE